MSGTLSDGVYVSRYLDFRPPFSYCIETWKCLEKRRRNRKKRKEVCKKNEARAVDVSRKSYLAGIKDRCL